MPLHLLGKKSWNVYNPANIEKVKRDEAAAKAREEEENRQIQDSETQTRLAKLRGVLTDPDSANSALQIDSTSFDGPARSKPSRKRKLPGEDDTDRDIRLAINDKNEESTGSTQKRSRKQISMYDADGHINLFPEGKNASGDGAKRTDKPEHQDPYSMRFSNAAGYGKSLSAPWYSTSDGHPPSRQKVIDSKTNGHVEDDPGQAQRAQLRQNSNDPLSMIKKGVRKLKEVEKERREWNHEREIEMDESARALRRKPRKEHRKHDRDRKRHNRSQTGVQSGPDNPQTTISGGTPRRQSLDPRRRIVS